MNAALLEQIVHATLYEGYILYPYRASSKKNQRERFTFGRVYPAAYSDAQKGAEACEMQSECLMKITDPAATVAVSVRFLQPMARTENGEIWHEAVERTVNAPTMELREGGTRVSTFLFPALREGMRRQEAMEGTFTVTTVPVKDGVYRVTAVARNNSRLTQSEVEDSDAVLMRLMASTHVVLEAVGAEFISQTDPPAELRAAVEACRNIGVWPVLVGDEAKGERDTMLCSPIILYDYPKIAPESAGPMFDGTEIDEILTLRIMTMTDEEKREMRGVDEQARRLLERTETLPPNALMKMHGMMRGASPIAIEFDDFFGDSTKLKGVSIGGVFVQAGHRVRLRPKSRADAIDMILTGQLAIVEAVEQDLERRVHLAVVLENDPGKDLGMMRQPGHRFFYGVDEVEPVAEGVT